MVVNLTQKQHEFLKTFGYKKNLAFYYISRWGYNHNLKDGNGRVYENNIEAPFNIDEKEKMLNAMINGYDVIVPKFKFYKFVESSYDPLYYAGKFKHGKFKQLTDNEKDAVVVEKGSKDYIDLENLGFCKEYV